MKTIHIISLLSLSALATGCASIVSGTNQSVSVEARNKGVQVANANCKLSNDKGSWFVTTPGSVIVNRSFNDMAVRCEKDGVAPGLLTAKSSTKGMAFGNILFGGIIGAGVDISTGAAYDYPSLFSIEMGETITIAPPAAEQARADVVQASANPAN